MAGKNPTGADETPNIVGNFAKHVQKVAQEKREALERIAAVEKSAPTGDLRSPCRRNPKVSTAKDALDKIKRHYAAVKRYRENHIEIIREKDRIRKRKTKEKRRIEGIRRRAEHPEIERRWRKKYYKKHHEELLKRMRERNPKRYTPKEKKRILARQKAQYHISADKCEVCGNKRGLVRHHDDYFKPLDVKVLCRACHGREHRRYK